MISRDTPEIKVKCNVKDCEYNKSNSCHARSLEINPIGSDNKANTSDGTCCTTFKCCD
jgi:hypothetical protein